ncbi:MAG: hypothetical protein ACRDDN_15655, partial [Aeromonas veronii]
MLYHRSDLFGGKPIYSGYAAGFSAKGKGEKMAELCAVAVSGESRVGRGEGKEQKGQKNPHGQAHVGREKPDRVKQTLPVSVIFSSGGGGPS